MQALAVYAAWFSGMLAMHLLLPGKLAPGTVLPDGSRLQYKLNGECRVRPASGQVLTDS